MIIATCGHVDHGKTRLVHALTGIDTDRLEEEQARGLTIDLGFAYANFGDQRLGFIDVPGHIRFIDNMLAGVSVIDFGLLVIAADDGPMPQTREHLAIMELLRLTEGAVVITKVDRVSETRVAEVTADIQRLLAHTALGGKPVFPVSSVTGAGITELREALASAASNVAARSADGHFRLAIDRAFNIKGSGIVVTGSVFDGQVAEGDELRLMPQQIPVRVRGIHRQNQPARESHAGDRCSLNLAGANLSRDLFHRGDWLTTNPSLATSRADASIQVLATEPGALRHWTPVHIHSAANHLTGRVATLEADRIEPGARGLVQLVMSRPINLCRADRLIIRDQAATRTIGGGVIVDPDSPPRGRKRPERLEHLKALLADSVEVRLKQCLEAHPDGLDALAFRNAENLTLQQWRKLTDNTPGLVMHGSWMVSAKDFDRLGKLLLDGLERWHNEHARSAGASRQQLAEMSERHIAREMTDPLIAQLVEAGKLTVSGNVYALPGHAIHLTPQDARLWARLQPILESHTTRPPVVHELARQVAHSHTEVQKVLLQCLQMGYVVRPVANRFFVPQALATLQQAAREVAELADDGMFTVKQYRDATDIGRNLSIEILEYFDRTGFTSRIGDKRKLADRSNVDPDIHHT